MPTIINTRLGETRGKKRLWLEGTKLKREGYQPGDRYDIKLRDTNLLLKPSDSGQYVISKRTRNGKTLPVIEVTGSRLESVFGEFVMLRVLVQKGRITVAVHHKQEQIRTRLERLKKKLISGEALRVCSLFTGGAVLDLALHTGFQRSGIASAIGVSVEIESAYIESSLSNVPEIWNDDSIVIESGIEDVNLQNNPEQYDVLCGGVPCTGASLAGRAKNKLKAAEEHEQAGAMFFFFLQFIRACQPAIIIMENVPPYQNTASMAVIRSTLRSFGYAIQERILDGNEFGCIESRQRLAMVALTKGMERHFDLDAVLPIRAKESLVQDILDDVPLDCERWKPFTYLKEKEERDIAAGKGFKRQLLSGDEPSFGTVGRHYAKCRSTEPFIRHPDNPELSRLLTVAEHARAKGIPERVVAGVSETIGHQILGQSICFPAFEALASSLGESLKSFAGVNVINQVAA